MQCNSCGKDIHQGGLKTTFGDRTLYACDRDCRIKVEESLPFEGHGLESYSRVTGYLQNTDGWNAGKRQELRDRYRDKSLTEISASAVRKRDVTECFIRGQQR